MKESEPDFSTPLSLRNLFTHHDAHPFVLDVALLKTFKAEWLTWEPETLWTEIHRVFNTQISEHTRAKIQTLRTVHVTDSAWKSWNVFEKIIQGLNNNLPNWNTMQAPSLDQLYAGIDILSNLRKEEFSDEVKLYIASAVLNEEVTFVPSPLDFVQAEVSKPYWHCKKCENDFSALFGDKKCPACENEDCEERVKFNPDPVAEKWKSVENTPTADVQLDEDSEVDVQVAKLLIARDYMNIRRRQMAEQLLALKSWLGA